MGYKRRTLLARKSRDPRTKKRKTNRYKNKQIECDSKIAELDIADIADITAAPNNEVVVLLLMMDSQ